MQHSIVCLLLVLLVGVVSFTAGITIEWTGKTDEQWDVSSNWQPRQVPSINDDVLILNSTQKSVYIWPWNTAFARSITLGDRSILYAEGTLTVTDKVSTTTTETSVYIYSGSGPSTFGDVDVGTFFVSSAGVVVTVKSLKTDWLSLNANSILYIGKAASTATTLWLTPNVTLNGTIPASLTTHIIYVETENAVLKSTKPLTTTTTKTKTNTNDIVMWEKAQEKKTDGHNSKTIPY